MRKLKALQDTFFQGIGSLVMNRQGGL
jgi:hypothetical protein